MLQINVCTLTGQNLRFPVLSCRYDVSFVDPANTKLLGILTTCLPFAGRYRSVSVVMNLFTDSTSLFFIPSSSDNSTNQTPPASTSADSFPVNPSSSANQPLDKIRIAEDLPDPCGLLKLGNDQTVFLVDMLWSLHRATNIRQPLKRICCPLLHSTVITDDPGRGSYPIADCPASPSVDCADVLWSSRGQRHR